MSILGISPIGTGLGPFGGTGLITVLGIIPISNNTFSVIFDRVPKSLDPMSASSATNEENYLLEAIDPTITTANGQKVVPDGLVVPKWYPYSATATQDKEDMKQIIVASDTQLEAGVDYSVTISESICGQDGETFAGPNQFKFKGPGVAPTLSNAQISVERYRDFDYLINAPEGEKNMVYKFEDNNDIALQGAQLSLQKRIYRRIFTDPGAFSWAPNYGSGVQLKSLARTQSLQSLTNTINAQILQEPDVVDAGTEVALTTLPQGSFLYVTTRVKRLDARTYVLNFAEPI